MEETKKQNWLVRLWNYYSTYEKIWFFSITILAFVFAFIFPEEDIGGVNGKVIMALYLVDIFSNILCELLISKQSKWNFLVSLVVEFTEIAICIVCAYRFATMATTIFFWIPVDIISFFVWHKNPDREKNELTEVRTLKGWQELLVILGIIVWTIGIGYLLTLINVEEGILSDNPVLLKVVCYLDACCSVVGIANGLFILFRFREQWFAWYIATFLEIAMNIIAGQWVLLVLKAGYLSNTTYGMIKWSKYIKNKEMKDKILTTGVDTNKEEIYNKLTKKVKPMSKTNKTSNEEISINEAN